MFKFLGFDAGNEPAHRDPKSILADASACLEAENYEKAVFYFDELCALPVVSALPFLSRATCKLQLKQYEPAIEDCERVLSFLNTEIDENVAEGCTTIHSVALLRQAAAYKQLGDTEKAGKCLIRRDAIETKASQNKSKNSSRNRINADGSAQDQRESESSLEKDALKAEELREKGNVLYRKQDFKRALEIYREALNLDMYSEKLHSNACLCLIQLGDLEMATRHAQQCVDLQPTWAKGSYLLGKIAFIKGEYPQAESHFTNALRLDPKNTTVKAAFTDLKKVLNESSKQGTSTLSNRKDKNKIKNADNINSNINEKKEANKNGKNQPLGHQSPASDNGKSKPMSFQQYIHRNIKGIQTSTLIEVSMEIGASALGVVLTWAVITYSK